MKLCRRMHGRERGRTLEHEARPAAVSGIEVHSFRARDDQLPLAVLGDTARLATHLIKHRLRASQ